TQLRESARILGATDFIAELGGLTYYDLGNEIVRNYGAFRGRGTPYEAMARSGAAAVLLGEFPGHLEPHAPWAFENRECSMLLRGLVDESAARGILHEAGHSWLDLRDNGVIPRTFEGMDLPEIHAYHLVPAGVDKASAVRADLARRSLRGAEAVAIGDAPSDAALTEEVGAVFIVANGRENVERSGPWPDGVYATEGANGDGFAEAVLRVLGS
ncbi:MAG: HAD hydrolase family protein, partial [Actinomycetota bacterium]